MKKIIVGSIALTALSIQAYNFKLFNARKDSYDVHYYYWDGTIHSGNGGQAMGEILDLQPNETKEINTPGLYCLNEIWLRKHTPVYEDSGWWKAGQAICFDKHRLKIFFGETALTPFGGGVIVAPDY